MNLIPTVSNLMRHFRSLGSKIYGHSWGFVPRFYSAEWRQRAEQEGPGRRTIRCQSVEADLRGKGTKVGKADGGKSRPLTAAVHGSLAAAVARWVQVLVEHSPDREPWSEEEMISRGKVPQDLCTADFCRCSVCLSLTAVHPGSRSVPLARITVKTLQLVPLIRDQRSFGVFIRLLNLHQVAFLNSDGRKSHDQNRKRKIWCLDESDLRAQISRGWHS